MECERCNGVGWLERSAGGAVECFVCNGSGRVKEQAAQPQPTPTLADIITLLERQAKTCERIARTLGEIHLTVRQMK